ncbi:hypothetical protein ACYFX5_23685 [Bremerella sp. T1]|nr:hypothetical protein LA756_25630 [Bremerella volcania]
MRCPLHGEFVCIRYQRMHG